MSFTQMQIFSCETFINCKQNLVIRLILDSRSSSNVNMTHSAESLGNQNSLLRKKKRNKYLAIIII